MAVSPYIFYSRPQTPPKITVITPRYIRFHDAWDNAQLAIARSKIAYDAKHRPPPDFQIGDLVYVKLAKPGS